MIYVYTVKAETQLTCNGGLRLIFQDEMLCTSLANARELRDRLNKLPGVSASVQPAKPIMTVSEHYSEFTKAYNFKESKS